MNLMKNYLMTEEETIQVVAIHCLSVAHTSNETFDSRMVNNQRSRCLKVGAVLGDFWR
jgi:hypothetical protein